MKNLARHLKTCCCCCCCCSGDTRATHASSRAVLYICAFPAISGVTKPQKFLHHFSYPRPLPGEAAALGHSSSSSSSNSNSNSNSSTGSSTSSSSPRVAAAFLSSSQLQHQRRQIKGDTGGTALLWSSLQQHLLGVVLLQGVETRAASAAPSAAAAAAPAALPELQRDT